MHALLSFTWPGEGWAQIWTNSLKVTHPPALILLTHVVSLISRRELALRMIPVLAGTVFPFVVFLWLRRVAGKTAGMAAMLLLTLSPALVTKSAELRSYTLALLLASCALLAFEKAVDGGGPKAIWIFNFLLWACIFSDYSMAWFAGGMAICAVLRLRRAPAAAKAGWWAGQAVAMGMYGILLRVQIRPFLSVNFHDWLHFAFPRAGNRLTFPIVNSVKQFVYLMDSKVLGGLAAAVFAGAVVLLWTGRAGVERQKSRALALLLTVPFPLAIAGAYAHIFPFGPTRHTLVIGMFGAIGIAIAAGKLRPGAATATLWGMLALSPLWLWLAPDDPEDIPSNRNRRELMIQARDYMRASIPPGALIFSNGETLLILSYYLGDRYRLDVPTKFFETDLGGRWRVAVRDYTFDTLDLYNARLHEFRERYGIPARAPVWVVVGGGNVDGDPPADPARPFTEAMRVFQTESP